MAIDIKAIACPQCASTDIRMTSEKQGVCNVCGAQFTVQQRIDGGIHVHLGNEVQPANAPLTKAIIQPKFTKDAFLREAWIKLAAEDAPPEVFSEDFDEVQEVTHQVLMEKINAEVSYQVSIGYDRQEAYIDYETYYEDEPYIAYEQQFSQEQGKLVERQVTKYKKVARQRPVTKYKTVTDWSATNGNVNAESVAYAYNGERETKVPDAFVSSFLGINSRSLIPASAEQSKKMLVTKAAQSSVDEIHDAQIDEIVCNALPGDHYRDLTWTVTKEKKTAVALFQAPEYRTQIGLQGKTYQKFAFPFGVMVFGGDKIKNESNLDAKIAEMESDLKRRTYERKKETEDRVSKTTAPLSYLTIGVLAASILLSLFVRSTLLVVLAFVTSIILFILCELSIRGSMYAETKLEKEEISADRDKTRDEIENYSVNHKAQRLDLLNSKLQALGYAPAKPYELGDFDGIDPADLEKIANECKIDDNDEIEWGLLQ